MIVLGLKTLVGQKILPKKDRIVHLEQLLNNKEIPLSRKVFLLGHPRLANHWNVIQNPSKLHIKFRDEFEIDTLKHLYEFDPSGETMGCGCVICQLNHKLYLLDREMKTLRLQRNILLNLLNIQQKGHIPGAFFQNYDEHVKFIYTGLKSPKILERNITTLAQKEVSISEEITTVKTGLIKILKLTGLPIHNKEKKTFKEKHNVLKELLLNTDDLSKLSLVEEIIPLCEYTGIPFQYQRERVQYLQKKLGLFILNLTREHGTTDEYSKQVTKYLETESLLISQEIESIKDNLIAGLVQFRRTKLNYIP